MSIRAALSLVVLLLAHNAYAICTPGTHTWTGGGVNANWSTAANWGGSPPGCDGDTLVFPTVTANTNMTNDFAANRIFGTIIVSGDNYVFGGAGVEILTALTTSAPTVGPVFAIQITTGPSTLTITNTGAQLKLGSTANMQLNAPLVFTGSGDISSAGELVGTFGWSKTGTNRLYMPRDNSSLTATNVAISGGEVQVSISQTALGSATTTVTISGTGTLEVNAVNVKNPLVFDTTTQPVLTSVGGGGDVEGPITLMTDATVSNSSLMIYTISSVISGPGKLHFTSPMGGAIAVSGDSTYTGGTISDAPLQIYEDDSLGTGPITVNNGGALELDSVIVLSNDVSLSGTDPGISGAVYVLRSGALTGKVTLVSDSTLYIEGNQTLSIPGLISGPGGLINAGPGTLSISNAGNSYAGQTHVVVGTVTNSNVTNAIPSTSVVTVDSLATMMLSASDAVAAINGAGAINLSTGVVLTVGGTNAVSEFSGGINGPGGLAFVGTGTKTLSGMSTLGGGTTVTAGELDVYGGALGGVSVTGAKTQLGSGASVGTVSLVGSTFDPGGVLAKRTSSSASFTLDSASTFSTHIDGETVGAFSQLSVTGTVTLAGKLAITAASGLALGQKLIIVANDGTDAVSGTFANLPEGGIVGSAGVGFQVSYVGGDGNDVTLTTVTEPADMALPPDMAMADLALTADLVTTGGDDAATQPADFATISSPKHSGCDMGGGSASSWLLVCLMLFGFAVLRRYA